MTTRWDVHPYDSTAIVIQAKKPGYVGRQIASVVCAAGIKRRDVEANATLIAAAPELLEALRDVLGWYETQAVAHALTTEGATSSYHKTLRHAKAAIRKATR